MFTTETIELLTKIKTDRDQARVEKNTFKVGVLATLIGEIETGIHRGLITSEAKVVALIKKFRNDLSDTCKIKGEITENDFVEIAIYESYLPKQLTEDEIRGILSDVGNIKDAMLRMKKYVGQFDAGFVASLYKGVK